MEDMYNSKIAKFRSSIYAFLTEAFIQLPNEEFIKKISNQETRIFLAHTKKIHNDKIRKGIGKIENFIDKADMNNLPELIEAMAVDRTRIVRPTGKKLRPPYEGLYKKGENANAILLNVKKSYREYGELPFSNTNDAADFFCTELDFMRQLCIMEAEGGNSQAIAKKMESKFIDHHIGRWIGYYCGKAQMFAKTDFYNGLLMFLDGFIELEKE